MKFGFFRIILLRHLLFALIGVACVATIPTYAAGPVTGSVTYRETGRVDNVDLTMNQIVIGDRAYVLASNVSVLAGDKTSSTAALKKGMNLGFNSTADQHRSVITEIWILPTR